MKNKILSFLLCCGMLHGKAQIQEVHNVTPTNVRTVMNNLYQNLNFSGISSGVLIDKGLVTESPIPYDGNLSTCGIANRDKWLALYRQIYYGRINTSWSMPNEDNLFATLGTGVSSSTTPFINGSYTDGEQVKLSVLFANYHHIVPNSSTTNYFVLNNGQLSDNSSNTQNPYSQSTLVAATVWHIESKSGRVKYIFPSNLYLSNIATGSSVLMQVDFGDGSGYVNFSPGSNYMVDYSSTGTKSIIVKLTYNGTTYYAKSSINVLQASSTTNVFGKNCSGICYDMPWKDAPYTTAEAYIIYANGRSHIEKPVIFAEGQDVLDDYNFRELYEGLNGGSAINSNGALEQLINNGYDVILLNFLGTGGSSLRDNAEVMRRLIKWTNLNKQGTNQLIVGGISMGALVARYTLAKMENVYCENHNARLYVSYDGPHQGANIPLSMQKLTAEGYGLSLGLSADLAIQYYTLIAQSSQELLVSYVFSNGGQASAYTSFHNELNQLGMPQQCRSIAVSNGNTFSSYPDNGAYTFSGGDQILAYSTTGGIISTINAFAVNTTRQVLLDLHFEIYSDIEVPWYLGGGTIYPTHIIWDWVVVDDHPTNQSPAPYDNVPGSYLTTQYKVAVGLGGNATTFGRYNHCMIPATSALNIRSNNYFLSKTDTQINTDKNASFDAAKDADNYLCFDHKIIEPSATTFFVGEIFTPQSSTISIASLVSQTYNFGNGGSFEQSLPNVQIGSGSVLQINGNYATDFGGGPVPPLSSTFVTSTSACPAIIAINSGGKMIIGDITPSSDNNKAEVTISSLSVVEIFSNGQLTINCKSSA